MARRGWADKLADAQTCPQCAEQYGMGDNGDIVHVGAVVRLLHKEHARAVRIVSQYMKKYGTEGSPCELICNDLLDLLQKGRA